MTDQELKRIKREADLFREIDILDYIDEMMPWNKHINYSIKRFSELMDKTEAPYALIGEYALNFYHVPNFVGEIAYSIKGLDLKQLSDSLERSGFRRLAYSSGRLALLDLQVNIPLTIYNEPEPLRWDDEMSSRLMRAKIGTKLLSPEDYAIFLILRNGSREIELAAKILYLNLDVVDRDYLIRRSREYNLSKVVSELLGKIS
ncbi:MAG: hypothetical protein ABDH32_04260 [Candidatus Caldarchaeales archaeon]